jgi:electron transfer flavoprotein beta subunit
MKTVVVLRQVPDLVEPLEIAASGTALDLDEARFIVNETDDHALEQALILKESTGGSVTVVALDFGAVDGTLYAAVAKGADQVIKIAVEDAAPPAAAAAAAMLAEVIGALAPELVLIGCQTHDELEGPLGPRLAHALGLPWVGVLRGVESLDGTATVRTYKEFPGAARAAMRVELPAALGILAADQPPRYVPVSRIRAVTKSTQFDLRETAATAAPPQVTVTRLRAPEAPQRAEILQGSDEEIAAQIAAILREKGLVK